jgi:AcrR family transcriptional regulator
VEQLAIRLMRRDGYDNVSVDAIVAAAGIGRMTFFRYFGSKPGVVWYAFDDTITWLAAGLRTADDDGAHPLDAVRAAIMSSTRSAVLGSDVWLERFEILDTTPALRAGAYEHWERWKQVIAEYIASRAGGADLVIPAAIAGACQGVFIAELRSWLKTSRDRDMFLLRLDQSLLAVTATLREVLPAAREGS